MVNFTKINQVSSPTNTPRGFHVETTWKRRGVFVLLPLLNVAGYWKSSNTEACVKTSQIIANSIDNGGGGLVSKFM